VNDPRIKKWLGQVVGKEGEDLTRHDKWLCMMYPRLKLLHRLLAKDGVIFISIDDNEQANLKLVMDEIFGYRNFIGPIIQNKMNAKNDSLNIQKNHEFILIYGKAGNVESTLLLSDKSHVEKKVFEENGYYYFINDSITTRGEGGTLNARQNLGYTIYYNPKTNDKVAMCDYDISLAKESNDEAEIYSIDANLTSKGYFAIRPPKVRNKLGAWTWDLDKFNKDKHNIIVT
jgi:adenine-specific DNA-methyltransferase